MNKPLTPEEIKKLKKLEAEKKEGKEVIYKDEKAHQKTDNK